MAENDIANALIAPAATGPPSICEILYFFPLVVTRTLGAGFDADDGAVLCMTFRALQLESVKQGEAHKAVAHDLVSLVADPFGEWASGHAVCLGFTRYYAALKVICVLKARIEESRKVLIDGWLKAYEMAIGDVSTHSRLPSHINTLQVDKLKHTYVTKSRRADEAEDE